MQAHFSCPVSTITPTQAMPSPCSTSKTGVLKCLLPFLCLSSPRMLFPRQLSKPHPRRPLSLGTASALCSDLLQPLESQNPTQRHRPAWASRVLTVPTRQPGWFWNSSGMFPWSRDLPDFPLELHRVSAPLCHMKTVPPVLQDQNR